LIDLAIVSKRDLLKTISQISFGPFTSHDLIFGSYGLAFEGVNAREPVFFRSFRNINRGQLLQTAASLNWDAIFILSDIDDMVSHVSSLLCQLVERCVPLRKVCEVKNSQPKWFSVKLERLISARNYFHSLANCEKNVQMREQYRLSYCRLRNRVTLLKRNLKSQYASNFLDLSLPPRTLWTNFRNFGVVQGRNSSGVEDYESAEFNDYFSSVFSPGSTQNVSFDSSGDQPGSFLFENVLDSDVDFALKQISTEALGEDCIPASFLKLLSPFIIPYLTYIVNACFTQSYFPKAWKIAIVRPLPKVGNPGSVSDFRPISILPAMSKIIERIMKDQMQWFVDNNELLSPLQSGFRRGFSTTTAMTKVVDDLARVFDRGDVTAYALIDFRKAFDLVPHDKLLEKLKTQFNFSSFACNLLKSYLSDRF
jgi:Reverse transcriptase (RNA-dependent DNA polymerase)